MTEKYVLEVNTDYETGEEHCTVLKTDETTNINNWIGIVSTMYTHHSTLEPLVDELNKLHNKNEVLIQGILMKEEIINDLKDDIKKCNIQCRKLGNENEQLKSTIAQLIEQNRKNNDLLLSDIRILEKALWCGGCENDCERLKELRREFIR